MIAPKLTIQGGTTEILRGIIARGLGPAMIGASNVDHAAMNRDGILELEEQRYQAMLGADLATLDRLLDDQLTYTHSSGVVDTKASYMAGVRDKVWEYTAISRENEKVIVRGNCALVFCRLRIDVSVRGTPRKVDSNALAVWVTDGLAVARDRGTLCSGRRLTSPIGRAGKRSCHADSG